MMKITKGKGPSSQGASLLSTKSCADVLWWIKPEEDRKKNFDLSLRGNWLHEGKKKKKKKQRNHTQK